MYLHMLKAKIHRAAVTGVEVDYEGSCGVDRDLLTAAGILGFEQVDVYNVTNGARLTTYAIPLAPGSAAITLNGAAAHLAAPGDRVIICAYGLCTPDEAARHEPVVVHVDAANRITAIRGEVVPESA